MSPVFPIIRLPADIEESGEARRVVAAGYR